MSPRMSTFADGSIPFTFPLKMVDVNFWAGSQIGKYVRSFCDFSIRANQIACGVIESSAEIMQCVTQDERNTIGNLVNTGDM